MLKNAKKTKIVCTLGPASDSEEVLTQLVENGLNVCRFNFSHGDHAEQKVRMDTAKRVREKLNVPVALLLDTKGPEIRTGKFADPEVLLEQGQQFIVTMDDVLGTKEKCTVSYKELVNDVKVGDTILIDDGLVGLKINEIKGNDIICTVENSGIVKNHKGVNLPGVKINLPALTPKDISDIEFGIEQDIDFIGKPVITATQMLDSMIRNPRPTRAEVTDVANAIYDGTDAIMLSGETAAGKYPVEAVKVMASISKRIEETLKYEEILRERNLKGSTVTDAISYATCTTAIELNASAIVSSTSSGYTARMVSKFRPKTPIIAATDSERTRRQLALSWGVYSVQADQAKNTDDVIEYSINAAKEADYVKQGELVVVTAGVPVGESGTTNLIKVHVMSEEIAMGMGVGRDTVEGRVKIVKDGETCVDFNEGDILVTSMTNSDMNQYIEKAAAIVTEEGGMTSHAAIVGINLGKPVVMSASDIMNKVENGEIVTVDATRGVVYRGSSRVL